MGHALPMGSRASLGRKNWFLVSGEAKIPYPLYLKSIDIDEVPKQKKYYACGIKISWRGQLGGKKKSSKSTLRSGKNNV